MSDLHAVLTARIDEEQAYVNRLHAVGATRDRRTHNLAVIVWRGLAEDRDILRRHRHYTKANGQVTQLFCAGCDDGDAWITNGVGCEWLLSVARRLNVEVS